MTVEDQIWEELVKRTQFATARQISRKLMVPHSTVRNCLFNWTKREVLDVKVRANTNYYRIKE